MMIKDKKRGRWATTFMMVGVVLAGTFLLAQGARADDVEDGLQKIKAHADCVAQCNSTSLGCMAGCPNGQAGASCRAGCVMASNSCVQSCP